ncbi:MAG: hypothetical protein M0Q44_07690 [Methylobacter sp.]|jgi:hypothetical protein|nr:hypothetical protein [Methylobacter sp.]
MFLESIGSGLGISSVSKKRLYQAIILAGCIISQACFASSCTQGDKTHIWISPRVVKAGMPVNIMAVSGSQAVTELVLTNPKGEKQLLKATANNGAPWYLSAQIEKLGEGRYQLEAKDQDKPLACREVFNGDNGAEKHAGWNDSYEAFYSAWIEQLFDSPADESLSFRSLEPVLRDSERNFLHNYLGLNEDKVLPATPDCADFPYFLRSYFAWKNGLPFSYRACSRGTAKNPPVCNAATIITDFVQHAAPPSTFKSLSHALMDVVHSGNGRTALASEATDFYPVALRREALWPGTIYADPYGHVLVLVKWVPQTANSPGILFAADAQPDNSIGRKRFWEGTFLFANSTSAGAGFKAFRPLADSGTLLSNGELPDYSTEQGVLSPEDFYAQLYKLINPNGLDARQAYEATLAALVEQLETRLQSVENGEDYFRKQAGTIEMPKGAAIFETIGAWEDYATPSRDMRLLIAINVLLDFPEKVVRYPELFNLTAQSAAQVKIQIGQLHEKLIAEKKIQYVRSNGKPWELSVAEILARKSAFEMAYNPNDCVEIRWGAKAGTEEYASCKRHAPQTQVEQMTAVRGWFRDTKRPPR